jgi:hypothetical protein
LGCTRLTPLSRFRWRSCLCPCSVAYASWRSFLGCFVFVVAVNDGDNPVVLALCSCFTYCVHPHPSMTKRGGARLEVGWAHIHGGCDVLVDLAFGVFLAVFGSVRVRFHVCWPSTDRWWVLTALGSVSRMFSWCSWIWGGESGGR